MPLFPPILIAHPFLGQTKSEISHYHYMKSTSVEIKMNSHVCLLFHLPSFL